MPTHNEQEEKTALSNAMSALAAKSAPTSRAVMFQYLAAATILTIGIVTATDVPLPPPAPITLWPILLAVLICKIWIGLRAARFTAAAGIVVVFISGVGVFTDGVLDRADLAQALWCAGWAGVIWGIAVLSRPRTASRFERFVKRL